MNRLLALLAGILVSFFWVAAGVAASSAANDPAEQEQVIEEGSEGQAAATPQATMSWQEQEKVRFENQKRAAAQRQLEMNRAKKAIQDQQTVK